MGFFTRLFGQTGKVRFKGITAGGRTFTGKISIEVDNMNKKEIEIKNILYTETGDIAKDLHIVAFAET